MTERDRLQALLLCSVIVETAERLRRDLDKMQEAAEDFAASIDYELKIATDDPPPVRTSQVKWSELP